MSGSVPIYDLGEVALRGGNASASSGRSRNGRGGNGSPTGFGRYAYRGDLPPSAAPAVAGTMSLFVPGAGQLVLGEWRPALFFSTAAGLAVALGWSILTTFDRLISTLGLLGVPAFSLAVALAVFGVVLAAFHVWSTLDAVGSRLDECRPRLPHPLLAGLASATFPGWGQILATHKKRAALFLTCSWLLGGAWLLALPYTRERFAAAGLVIPDRLVETWGPFTLISASAVVWTLSVYDGVAGALAERRRAN